MTREVMLGYEFYNQSAEDQLLMIYLCLWFYFIPSHNYENTHTSYFYINLFFFSLFFTLTVESAGVCCDSAHLKAAGNAGIIRIEIISLCWTLTMPQLAIFTPVQHLCWCDIQESVNTLQSQHTVRPCGFCSPVGDFMQTKHRGLLQLEHWSLQCQSPPAICCCWSFLKSCDLQFYKVTPWTQKSSVLASIHKDFLFVALMLVL